MSIVYSLDSNKVHNFIIDNGPKICGSMLSTAAFCLITAGSIASNPNGCTTSAVEFCFNGFMAAYGGWHFEDLYKTVISSVTSQRTG